MISLSFTLPTLIFLLVTFVLSRAQLASPQFTTSSRCSTPIAISSFLVIAVGPPVAVLHASHRPIFNPGELAQPQDFAVGEVADADLPWVYTGYIG